MRIDEIEFLVTTKKKLEQGVACERIELCCYYCIEDLIGVIRELFSDESDPEFIYKGLDYVPKCLITENWINKNIYDYVEALYEESSDMQDLFFEWMEESNIRAENVNIHESKSVFNQTLIGKFETDRSFGEYMVNDDWNIPEFCRLYFDYESYAKDLLGNGFKRVGDYIFLNN